jgi:hypothetical protein
MAGNKHWTKSELATLKEHYRFINGHKLTEAYEGRTYSSIRSMARRMGLKKCHDRMREMGRENRLQRPMQKVEPPSAA